MSRAATPCCLASEKLEPVFVVAFDCGTFHVLTDVAGLTAAFWAAPFEPFAAREQSTARIEP